MKIYTLQKAYAAEAEARRQKVLKLRQQGFKWAEIGRILGVSHQRAHQMGKKAASK
jgi:transcriptional regulator